MLQHAVLRVNFLPAPMLRHPPIRLPQERTRHFRKHERTAVLPLAHFFQNRAAIVQRKLFEARFAASAPSGHRRAGKTDPDRAVLPAGRPPLPSNRKGHSTLARFGLPATPETLPAPARILSQPEMTVQRLPVCSFFAIASTWLSPISVLYPLMTQRDFCLEFGMLQSSNPDRHIDMCSGNTNTVFYQIAFNIVAALKICMLLVRL